MGWFFTAQDVKISKFHFLLGVVLRSEFMVRNFAGGSATTNTYIFAVKNGLYNTVCEVFKMLSPTAPS